MNTPGNSNTKHWCRYCGKSQNHCRSGVSFIPCHILKKLAIKTSVFYDELWIDENLMPDDVYVYVRDKMQHLKYTKNQIYSHETIVRAISYIIFDDYAPDAKITIDDMFEFEDSTYGVSGMVEKIREMDRKIRGYDKL